MPSAAGVPPEAIWDDLGARFDRVAVERYRALAADPGRAFDAAHAEFRGAVATLSGGEHDINRDGAKRALVLGHLLLALLDALRRGVRTFTPLPPPGAGWAAEETALLLWAAAHGASDVRASRVQQTPAGERM